MLAKVTGRVVQAQTVDDSDRDFIVTLGPPPDLVWFKATGRPPHLGQLVSVFGKELAKQEIGEGDRKGSITEMSCQKFEVDTSTYASRHVPVGWIESVKAVMQRPLYRYQAEGAAWVATRIAAGSGAILGDEPGVGKTVQTVAMLCALRPFPAVIVCPATLKHQWYREFSASKRPPKIFIASGKKERLPKGYEVYILNYDILYAREAELLVMNPALYVFDEAQELRNPHARGKHRAASATRLVRQRSKGALLLTGTPVENRPAELWRLLHLCEPVKWPRFADYTARYLKPVRGKEIGRVVRTQAGKVERLNELHLLVDQTMLRRLKTEVLKDLPPKNRRSVLVQIDDGYMQHYRAAEKDVVAWLQKLGKFERAAEAKKAESIVKLTTLRRIAALGKLRYAIPQYLRSWFDSRTKEPLVIFGYHKDVMLGVHKICVRLGLRVVGIGGGESSEKRQKAVDLFQSGKADVFLAPIRSAGVGLNLQRASEALFVERIWTPSGMIQAEDRVYRIGSKRPVTITYLDAAHTVDEHIAQIVEAKQRLIRAVVDDDHQLSESLETVTEVVAGLVTESK